MNKKQILKELKKSQQALIELKKQSCGLSQQQIWLILDALFYLQDVMLEIGNKLSEELDEEINKKNKQSKAIKYWGIDQNHS